ncbi:MAG: FMN-binding protein [Microgenomates group bacterium]
MNIKKNSFAVLGLVLGVSVILYIFDVPIISTSKQIIPTESIPTLIPTSLPVVSPSTLAITPTYSSFRQVSETVDYSVKRFSESITVNATFSNQTIIDLQIKNQSTNGESAAYQEAFATEIKQYVIGKKISEINISRIAGASYTSVAFMEAISRMQSKI